MSAQFGIVVFPGTWSDEDCHHAVHNVLGHRAEYIFHKETDLADYDCLVLPGGFSYGDYLRPGAIARFSPIMDAVTEFAHSGGLVIGICNGFQILCESGLLPGTLMRNQQLQFRCEWVSLRVEKTNSPFTGALTTNQVIRIPISHGDGNYFADQNTIQELENNHQVVFRYVNDSGAISHEANPNGSINHIAGITNKTGNVLGMMPHPERAVEHIIGGEDGKLIFESIIQSIQSKSHQRK
jgi:phosphoribosylformylglycinamidine synthase I